MPDKLKKRIDYVDWTRGLASIIMLQGHCFDSWLSGAGRESAVFSWSQLIDTLPAPLFLFLTGFSFAVVTDKLRQRGNTPDAIARRTIWRGGQVLLLALLFRLQEFLLGQPYAPWTDLFRVDVLNTIGLSLVMMGLACRIAATSSEQDPQYVRRASIVTALVTCATVAVMTPQLYTVWRPQWLPWWLESYFNGVHTFGTPQSWMFPLFPWSAFAFGGLVVGFLMVSGWARKNEDVATTIAGLGGIALIGLGLWLDSLPIHLYSNYDFWHTSPNFFLIRAGIVLVILKLGHLWCRSGAAKWVFSPLMELGKCSLLIYWIHAQLVYGRYSLLPKGVSDVSTAIYGLLVIYALMITIASFRNRLPQRVPEILAIFRRQVRSEAGAE